MTDDTSSRSAQMGLKLSGKKASGYVHQLVMLAANTMDGFIPWCEERLRQFDKMGLKVSSFTTLHLYRSMHVFFYGHTLFFTQKKT